MRTRLGFASLLAFGILLPVLAVAQLPTPATPFSADFQTTFRNTEPLHGKFYFTPRHIRFDMQGSHGEVVLLTDFTSKTTDMLVPAQRTYMEVKVDEATGRRLGVGPDIKPLRDPNNPCADNKGTTCKKVGVEQVNGRTCDRWLITQRDGSFSTVWVDQKLHFPIKTETKGDTWLLTNIKEGEPSAALFVVPAGYRKLEVNSRMGAARHPAQ